MSAPHEAGAPRESVVRAVFAPDTYWAHPERAARVKLVLDYHGPGTRTVSLEWSGPLAGSTTPRWPGQLELRRREQHRMDIKVLPGPTQPEGAQHYELTALVLDPRNRDVLFSASVRIGVDAAPDFEPKKPKCEPTVVQDQRNVQVRVEVRNTGNVPLELDSVRFGPKYWIRDGEKRAREKRFEARRRLRAERYDPRTPEDLLPDQPRTFELILLPPAYRIGFGRTWQVPVGVRGAVIRGDEVDPKIVFAEFRQEPVWKLEPRMVWLAVAVVAALLVLIVFMLVLAG